MKIKTNVPAWHLIFPGGAAKIVMPYHDAPGPFGRFLSRLIGFRYERQYEKVEVDFTFDDESVTVEGLDSQRN